MCGIFGYIGPKNPVDVCIQGLSSLEYRGYDSSGIVGVHEKELLFCKEAGKISNLKEAVTHLKRLRNAIAHTRWATHGKPSKENAHPHFDELNRLAVVHNGIVENYVSIRESLLAKGVHFRSETDTETIAQLIASFYEGDLVLAVQKALEQLKGFWALAVVHKDHPDTIIAAAKENPLAIGMGACRTEIYLSSDVNAFNQPDLDIFFLESNEIAEISPQGVHIFNASRVPISKTTEKLSIEHGTLSKNGFAHFMLKEIFEQPNTIRQAMHGRFQEDLGIAIFEEIPFSPEEVCSFDNVLILACGTSFHAGYLAASWIEENAQLSARAEIASEFRYRNAVISKNTLVLAISQSGETFDTIAAVREVQKKGAKVLAICNAKNSTLTRDADACVFLKAGPEISVCSTKAFTSQLTVLSLLTLWLARSRGRMSLKEGSSFLQELQQIPAQVDFILRNTEMIQSLADKYSSYPHFFFLGRSYMFATALEGALKLKEISYIHAEAYPAGEMKHGPIALIDEMLAVIGLCGNTRTLDKTLSNLLEVKSRGAPILALAPIGTAEIAQIATDVLWIPPSSEELACIPYSVAMQMLAYYIALKKGADIDQPRNLAKSVTVE
jgi:glucosamine--fructose-6-phosphate aminotransferase (isomerizing)